MTKKKYTGSCYVGVVGPDHIPILAVTSIMQMTRREGDGVPQFVTATKGYVARQQLVDSFMASDHDFLLLLDHDMIFEADTLERLRSHGLPFVSGLYMRRQFAPMYPVWFEPFEGEWPHRPFMRNPKPGRLYELGASGWGCMLIHRDVITTTREVLKGEPDILEDDMDVWPYDLGAVLRGDEEVKPLRGVKDSVIGSDIRYPFYAKEAGWTLYGDPEVRPRHILQYPLSPDDFGGLSVGQMTELQMSADDHVKKSREKIRESMRELL